MGVCHLTDPTHKGCKHMAVSACHWTETPRVLWFMVINDEIISIDFWNDDTRANAPHARLLMPYPAYHSQTKMGNTSGIKSGHLGIIPSRNVQELNPVSRKWLMTVRCYSNGWTTRTEWNSLIFKIDFYLFRMDEVLDVSIFWPTTLMIMGWERSSHTTWAYPDWVLNQSLCACKPSAPPLSFPTTPKGFFSGVSDSNSPAPLIIRLATTGHVRRVTMYSGYFHVV